MGFSAFIVGAAVSVHARRLREGGNRIVFFVVSFFFTGCFFIFLFL
jgi:hypothetical protein